MPPSRLTGNETTIPLPKKKTVESNAAIRVGLLHDPSIVRSISLYLVRALLLLAIHLIHFPCIAVSC